MTYEELLREARGPQRRLVYILQGEDAAEVRRGGRELAACLVPAAEWDSRLERVDGRWSLEEFRFWLEAAPFFGGPKWLWWHGCPWLGEAGGDEIAAAAELVASWPAYAGLLLTATKVDKRTRFFKALVQAGAAVASCALLRPWEAEAWFLRRLQQEGKMVEPAAASLVASVFGVAQQLAPGWLEQEAAKLLLYTEGRSRVTAADVEAMTAASPEASSFALLDAIAAGDTAKALSLLAETMHGSASVFQLVPLLIRQARLVLRAQGLQGGKQELAQQLKVHPYVAEKLIRQARQTPPALLRRVLLALAALEGGIKTGTRTPLGELEAIVIEWCRQGK